MEIEVLAIEVNKEPIELYKLLKIANLVGGGGEAKVVISEGYVFLNGEVETQKRKKVYVNDIVQFNGEAIMPVLSYEDIEGDAIEQQANTEQLAVETEDQLVNEIENAVETNTTSNSHSPHKANQPNPKKKSSKSKSSAKSKKNNQKSKSSKSKTDSEKEKPRSGRRSISF